jgi:hypothetical protein
MSILCQVEEKNVSQILRIGKNKRLCRGLKWLHFGKLVLLFTTLL